MTIPLLVYFVKCLHLFTAICKMPKAEDMKIDTSQLHAITLICDNIRDPGNMGALLRSASAVGCRSVLLTKGKPLINPSNITEIYFSCGLSLLKVSSYIQAILQRSISAVGLSLLRVSLYIQAILLRSTSAVV